MARYTLHEVLSIFGKFPNFLEEENKGLNYGLMIAYSLETNDGDMLVELGTAGLAREFQKSLRKSLGNTQYAVSHSDRAASASHVMAEEYAQIILNEGSRSSIAENVCVQMTPSILRLVAIRFVSHETDSDIDVIGRYRKFLVRDPDEFGPRILTWLNRPIPFPKDTHMRMRA